MNLGTSVKKSDVSFRHGTITGLHLHVCINRRFYPKRLTVHSGYTCFVIMLQGILRFGKVSFKTTKMFRYTVPAVCAVFLRVVKDGKCRTQL